jgi:hypothetical protein
MKHLIVLPGNGIQNQSWGIRMASHYGEYFDSIHIAEYEHWKTGESNINLALEEEKLREHVATLPKETQITVLAKSAGSILTFLAVQSGVINPTYCVFFGIPMDWAAVDIFSGNWTVLIPFTCSAIAFHNEHDPTASYEYTKKIVENYLPKVSFITTQGEDHYYDDYILYDKYLLTMFQKDTSSLKHY